MLFTATSLVNGHRQVQQDLWRLRGLKLQIFLPNLKISLVGIGCAPMYRQSVKNQVYSTRVLIFFLKLRHQPDTLHKLVSFGGWGGGVVQLFIQKLSESWPVSGAPPRNFRWGDGFMGTQTPLPQNLASPRSSATLF